MEPLALQPPSAARFLPKSHSRTVSRSPTRPRLTDDILSDLSPQTTLEAFTSASGTLKASIETASPTQRAFGIRAAIASKKIHQWLDELVSWPWPDNNGQGFEIPAAKRRKLSNRITAEDGAGGLKNDIRHDRNVSDVDEYWGCLPAQDVICYETRVEDILEDMDDLDVEAIKRQILDTHILPKTRPSSGLDQQPSTLSVTPYTAMDDFTAIVTATVLQALPKLSHLIGLMNIWSVRLAILRQVPLFTKAMDDAEMALKRGWEKLKVFAPRRGVDDGIDSRSETPSLLRLDFEAMRDSLQDGVRVPGQQIDQMLDTLEGCQDTLPEAWLDRMEAIERDYGEWTVRGERRVREGEWAKDAVRRSRKKKVPSPTDAEVQTSDAKNLPLLPEDHQQPIQDRPLWSNTSEQPSSNGALDSESSTEPVEMPPTQGKSLTKSENSTHVDSAPPPSIPIIQQAEPSEDTPTIFVQSTHTNGCVAASGAQQRTDSSSLSRTQSTSESEMKPRRSKPFQAGFSWYLTHGEAGLNSHVASTNPIAEDLAQVSKPTVFNDIGDPSQLKQESHEFQTDDPMRTRSTTKPGGMNANGPVGSAVADKLLSLPVFSPLLADEGLHGSTLQDGLPADLSSSTDGIFEEVSPSRFSVLKEMVPSVDHSTSTNTPRSRPPSKSSKASAIESHPQTLDGQLPKGSVVTPQRPARIPRFGSGFANSLRQAVPLMAIPTRNIASPHRSLSTVRTENPRSKEADIQRRPQSFPNRSVVLPPDVGQDRSSVAISSASIASGAGISEPREMLQSSHHHTVALLPETAPREHSPQELLSFKSSEAPSPEMRTDVHNAYKSSMGSSAINDQPPEYVEVVADDGEDFLNPKIASADDSSIELPIDTTAAEDPPVQYHLAPGTREVADEEAVASEPPLIDSTSFPIPPKSTPPIADMVDIQKHVLSTAEPSEASRPVTPVPLSTDSLDSTGAAKSTPLITDSPPKEIRESNDPSINVHHANEPTDDELLVNKVRESEVDLFDPVTPRTYDAQSTSEPLAAADPLPNLHKPLDNTFPEQIDPVSIAMPSLDLNDPLAALVPTNLCHTNTSLHTPLPSPNVLAESCKAPPTLPTPNPVILDPSISELTPEMLYADDAEPSRPITPLKICRVDSTETVSTTASTKLTFGATPSSLNDTDSNVKDLEESRAVNSESQTFVAQINLPPPEMIQNLSPKHEELDDTMTENLSHSRRSSMASVIVRKINGDQVGTPSDNKFSDLSTTTEASKLSPVMVVSPDAIYESPMVEMMSPISLVEYDDDSPSIRRMRRQDDYSPPGSPLPGLNISKHRLPQLHTSQSFESDSSYLDSPDLPAEAPLLTNVEVSSAPPSSNATKTSDDQLQQQISEILESIPARIKLTSEPETTKKSKIPKLKKQASRPYLHPISRAPTPSFTLAPAYAKNPRPRQQNGTPEIKLYHLSRSTGEAPIKLFVRLVGENGERVMVRVGGGWADLGEYLKEYASHHGRRSDKEGKVEIQDLPSRVVSTGSNASTIRNGAANRSGRCSPASRPTSSLDRPISSLAVRKTRKSVGEEARERAYRSPSTPLPSSLRGSPIVPRTLETPPSVTARSVSRMSWTEEESALGLAGPKSRKVEISAENAAWVESMKEKVRMASAEKEKDKEKKPDFGEMDRVGTTKRLFKKRG